MAVSGEPMHINGERIAFEQGSLNRWRASGRYRRLGWFWTEYELKAAIKREQRKAPKPKAKRWWQ